MESVTKLAPPYDFAVFPTGDNPRSMVYDLDTGKEVCTFPNTPEGEAQAKGCCDLLNRMAESAIIPDTLDGHWNTPAGAMMAKTYIGVERAQLPHGELSDLEIANKVYMADRNDLDLIVWQTAAKQRIRWLSTQLALAMPVPR